MTTKQLDKVARQVIANIVFCAERMTETERQEMAGLLLDAKVEAFRRAFGKK